jgi:hypothetical protein
MKADITHSGRSGREPTSQRVMGQSQSRWTVGVNVAARRGAARVDRMHKKLYGGGSKGSCLMVVGGRRSVA